MLLCPIDLEQCNRRDCAGGLCALADGVRMNVCFECGALEAQPPAVGLCLVCFRGAFAAPDAEPAPRRAASET